MRASSIAMSVVMLVIFTAMTMIALLSYPDGARGQPLIIGIPAIALCVLQLVLDLRGRRLSDMPVERAPPVAATDAQPPPATRELRAWAWFLAFVATVLLAGFWIAVPVFVVMFLRFEAHSAWLHAFALGGGATAVLYALFGLLLKASLHEGFLLQWVKG